MTSGISQAAAKHRSNDAFHSAVLAYYLLSRLSFRLGSLNAMPFCSLFEISSDVKESRRFDSALIWAY